MKLHRIEMMKVCKRKKCSCVNIDGNVYRDVWSCRREMCVFKESYITVCKECSLCGYREILREHFKLQ